MQAASVLLGEFIELDVRSMVVWGGWSFWPHKMQPSSKPQPKANHLQETSEHPHKLNSKFLDLDLAQ